MEKLYNYFVYLFSLNKYANKIIALLKEQRKGAMVNKQDDNLIFKSSQHLQLHFMPLNHLLYTYIFV